MKNIVTYLFVVMVALLMCLPCRSEVKKGPVKQFTRLESETPQADNESANEDTKAAAQTPAESSKDNFVTKHFKAQNYQASYLAETVRLMLSPRGLLQSNDDLNIIIVTDKPDRVKEIEAMLETVDILPRQIVIHSKILEVKDTFERDFGLNLSDMITNGTYAYTKEDNGPAVNAYREKAF